MEPAELQPVTQSNTAEVISNDIIFFMGFLLCLFVKFLACLNNTTYPIQNKHFVIFIRLNVIIRNISYIYSGILQIKAGFRQRKGRKPGKKRRRPVCQAEFPIE